MKTKQKNIKKRKEKLEEKYMRIAKSIDVKKVKKALYDCIGIKEPSHPLQDKQECKYTDKEVKQSVNKGYNAAYKAFKDRFDIPMKRQPPSSVQDWEKELHIAMEEVRPADWYYKFIKALLKEQKDNYEEKLKLQDTSIKNLSRILNKKKDIPRSRLAQEVNDCPHLSCQCIICGEFVRGERMDEGKGG